MQWQQTIKKAFQISGIGLHSGNTISIKIKSAPANHGIVFQRVDLENKPKILACQKNVISTQLATVLGVGEVKVSTVEHLLAAFFGAGVDNALVEVSGSEIPILDGSSQIFYESILNTGIKKQRSVRSFIKLLRKVEVYDSEKLAFAEPASQMSVKGSIEWDHPSIGFQEYEFFAGKHSFDEIAAARTFGFLQDVEALQKVGLIQGGSLENAVVLDQTKVLNPEGLRYSNEFVRHKVLDALGDFMLVGLPIQARFCLHRAGHELHAKLVQKIFESPANYEFIKPTTEVFTPVHKPQVVYAT